jgi:hypothetical protein
MAIRLPAWAKRLARFFSQTAPAPNGPPDGDRVMDVKQFSKVELSNDGSAVIVTAECTGESGLTRWTVPYRHAVWLAKAIFSVSHEALKRQEVAGEIEPVFISQEALLAEIVQVLVKPNQQLAAIDSLGTWTSNSSPGTTTLLVDSTLAQALIDQLREFVQTAQALSRPS